LFGLNTKNINRSNYSKHFESLTLELAKLNILERNIKYKTDLKVIYPAPRIAKQQQSERREGLQSGFGGGRE
jgi:hypothetical protein